MEILRKYGESATILFPLIDYGAQDFEATPVTFAAGDTKISKDEGAFANTTNNPTHEGMGMYSLVLTATEMQAARLMVTLVDTATKAWEDQAIIISTYGNASAQHAFDLDTVSVAQTGDSYARLGAPAGASVSADVAATKSDTDAIKTKTDFLPSATAGAAGGVFIAGTNAATSVTTALTANITGNLSGTIGSLGAQAKADVNAEVDSAIADVIGSAGAGLSAVPWNAAWDAEVQSECADALIAYDPPTKAEQDTAFTEIKGATWSSTTDTLEAIRDKETDIEADTADLQTQIGTAGAGLTGLGGMSANMKDQVKAEVDGALDTAGTELSTMPTTTGTLRQKINFLFQYFRNKKTVTATTETLLKEDASTTLGTSTISDDGTTFTKGEMN
jgi:hypothetical protein